MRPERHPAMASMHDPTLSPFAVTEPRLSSETGNSASPGVSALLSAAVRPPSSTPAWRPSQRHTPKMFRTVSTTLVQVSAGWPVMMPVASHDSEPTRNTANPDPVTRAPRLAAVRNAPMMVAAVATQEMVSDMTAQCAGAPDGSDFDLAAELDHAVGGELEEVHRADRVAQHPGEQPLAPDRHARTRRRE